MMVRSSALLGILASISLSVGANRRAAAQWAMFSKQDQLQGKAIADVGELSDRSYLRRDSARVLRWLAFDGKQQSLCFDDTSSFVGSNAAALLLVDADKNTYIAVLSTSIGSVRVDVFAVLLVQCPSG
jgi:hypothetical protein